MCGFIFLTRWQRRLPAIIDSYGDLKVFSFTANILLLSKPASAAVQVIWENKSLHLPPSSSLDNRNSCDSLSQKKKKKSLKSRHVLILLAAAFCWRPQPVACRWKYSFLFPQFCKLSDSPPKVNGYETNTKKKTRIATLLIHGGRLFSKTHYATCQEKVSSLTTELQAAGSDLVWITLCNTGSSIPAVIKLEEAKMHYQPG